MQEIKEYIKSNGTSVWKPTKRYLMKFSHNKCWFTEANNAISSFHIEHFRPKKKVKKLKGTWKYNEQTRNWNVGYWWLTYNWRNYRLCCDILNSHKGNYFPLSIGSLVATNPTINHSTEDYVLLDPTVSNDVKLLGFDVATGEAIPKYDERNYPVEYSRARISIIVYHLNEDVLLLESRKQKLKELDKLKKRIVQNIFKFKQVDAQNLAAKKVISDILSDYFQDLVDLLNPKLLNSTYTAMVKVYLDELALTESWVGKYVFPRARKQNLI
ncbi:hypothetical protein [Flagellimonas maritima]|uniref:hypothetical protein n=1 Tax=Flagellimonas maritima TaxID=1383885 RepID=UPI000F4F24F7|nr:hypothetical protein [Allomuricauda aurantiaca]